jgi:Endonuclease/Exonuclease/phosphatase family
MGLAYHTDSLSVAAEPELLLGPRRYGVLIASRWPLHPLPSADMPWPERLLSALIETPHGPVELHSAHVPPGASNGWRKIETLEGIYRRLACPSVAPRILCGDFNTPQEEMTDGRLISWAHARTRTSGYRLLPSRGARWTRSSCRSSRDSDDAIWRASTRVFVASYRRVQLVLSTTVATDRGGSITSSLRRPCGPCRASTCMPSGRRASVTTHRSRCSAFSPASDRPARPSPRPEEHVRGFGEYLFCTTHCLR